MKKNSNYFTEQLLQSIIVEQLKQLNDKQLIQIHKKIIKWKNLNK